MRPGIKSIQLLLQQIIMPGVEVAGKTYLYRSTRPWQTAARVCSINK
jgi:hypothetical protein